MNSILTRTLLAWILATASLAALAQNLAVKLSQVTQSSLYRQAEFFGPTTTLEAVFSGGCGIMEGMATASDGRVFFTEITRSTACSDAGGVPGGRIWVYDPVRDGLKNPISIVLRQPDFSSSGILG